MAKKGVVIFDGEDKFIAKKKHVYNKNKGQAKEVFLGVRAEMDAGESLPQPFQSISEQELSQGSTPTLYNNPINDSNIVSAGPSQEVIATPIGDIPSLPVVNIPPIFSGGGNDGDINLNRPIASIDYGDSYVAPTPSLPSWSTGNVSPTPAYNDEFRKSINPVYNPPAQIESARPVEDSPAYNDEFRKSINPVYNAPIEPISIAPVPELPTYSDVAKPIAPPSLGGEKTCPEGMRLYYGTCIPISNTKAVCEPGYMKEYEGGPCVPIPPSDSIGGCGAGLEYKMGYRKGDLTPTMGCYPIGSNQDIGIGSSIGGILGGGSGSNIGGGGTTQGGGGNYADTPETPRYTPPLQKMVKCNDGTYDVDNDTPCIEQGGVYTSTTTNITTQAPPVQTTSSTTSTTTKAIVTTPTTSTTTSTTTLTTTIAPSKGNCQPPIYEAPKYYKWIDKGDCKWELVVDSATYPNMAPAPVLPIITLPIVSTVTAPSPIPSTQTTSTIQTTTTKSTLGTLPGGGGGGTSGGGGGGGSEEQAPTQEAPKKNYFWWYVGGALAIYLILKKKKN